MDTVKECSECPLCKYTRSSKTATIFYSLGRLIQKICPCCRAANNKLDKDYQKSSFLNK